MRLFKLVLPLVAVLLVAAACTGDNDEDGQTPVPPPTASAAPTATASAVATAPLPAEEEPPDPRENLAYALYLMLLMLNDEWPEPVVDQKHLGCVAGGIVSVFSDERLAELGMDAVSVTSAYYDQGPFGLGDVFPISDQEASAVADKAVECVDWRAVVAAVMAGEGAQADQAACIAAEISDEGLRTVAWNTVVFKSQDDSGPLQAEMQAALQACNGVREMFFNFLTQETGISEESARCVVDGMPDEMIQLMLGLDTSGEVEPPPGFDLTELQNRCLTPEEIESLNG